MGARPSVPAPEPARVTPTRLLVEGASLGPADPFPHLSAIRDLPEPRLDASVPPDMRARVRYGRARTALPYPRTSDYDRSIEPRSLPALELGNGVLTAVVLPGLGGRVWSLRDERHGRELLHRNPLLRFANFGLADAWFAGGIEWNLGSTGHSCLSTRPVHAAVLRRPEGDVLRLWEWERTRDLVLQLDLTLDGPRLLVSTRVLNPDPVDKPLYYWTNVAVPETAGTRVLCAADHAWRTSHDGGLDRVPVPHPDDGAPDVSRPRASEHAADHFYDVADRAGRFLAAVEPDGTGLGQTSTSRLVGRKLFVWGAGPGGTRWQEWLSGPGRRYCEIQAGACPTQLEHDRLPGGAVASWTESFTPLRLDPAAVAGDYSVACSAAGAAVHAHESPAGLEERHARWLEGLADRQPDDVLAEGSGWGLAEVLLRDGTWRHPAALPLPEVGDDSAAAVAAVRDEGAQRLDQTGTALPVPPVSDRWFALLRARRSHWWIDQALGINHHLRDDLDEAAEAYLRSTAARPSAVCERGLALIAVSRGDTGVALARYAAARQLEPTSRTPATEHLELLLDLGLPEECLTVEGWLPAAVRRHGRTRLLRARALAALGKPAAAADIMEDLEVPDLSEGARDLDRLWSEVSPGRPLPPRLDFRMAREEGT